ncbi:hypothetical protein D3C75_1296060 [compost metagenome]
MAKTVDWVMRVERIKKVIWVPGLTLSNQTNKIVFFFVFFLNGFCFFLHNFRLVRFTQTA